MFLSPSDLCTLTGYVQAAAMSERYLKGRRVINAEPVKRKL